MGSSGGQRQSQPTFHSLPVDWCGWCGCSWWWWLMFFGRCWSVGVRCGCLSGLVSRCALFARAGLCLALEWRRGGRSIPLYLPPVCGGRRGLGRGGASRKRLPGDPNSSCASSARCISLSGGVRRMCPSQRHRRKWIFSSRLRLVDSSIKLMIDQHLSSFYCKSLY